MPTAYQARQVWIQRTLTDFTAIRHFDYRHEFLAHEFQQIQASTG